MGIWAIGLLGSAPNHGHFITAWPSPAHVNSLSNVSVCHSRAISSTCLQDWRWLSLGLLGSLGGRAGEGKALVNSRAVSGEAGSLSSRLKAKPCWEVSGVLRDVSLLKRQMLQGKSHWGFPVGWAPFRSFLGTNPLQFCIRAGRFQSEVHLRSRLNRPGVFWLASSWVFPLESVLSKPTIPSSGVKVLAQAHQ